MVSVSPVHRYNQGVSVTGISIQPWCQCHWYTNTTMVSASLVHRYNNGVSVTGTSIQPWCQCHWYTNTTMVSVSLVHRYNHGVSVTSTSVSVFFLPLSTAVLSSLQHKTVRCSVPHSINVNRWSLLHQHLQGVSVTGSPRQLWCQGH